MFKPYKLTLAALALLFSPFANGQLSPSFNRAPAPKSISQPAPKVVFIGDWITYYWASAFAANPNWVNKGLPDESDLNSGSGGTQEELARFQSDVVSLHPDIVHILIGQANASFSETLAFPGVVPGFLAGLDAIVQEAKAANIKVVLGTEPPIFGVVGQLGLINSVIANYGAANNIPVINYADALCGSTGSLSQFSCGSGSDWLHQYGGGAYIVTPAVIGVFPNRFPLVVSTTGYALMTQMAETAIANMTLPLWAGWLQNVQQFQQYEPGSGNGGTGPGANATNVNTVEGGAIVQFTPVGYYSDGSQHLMLNTSFQGSSGTWTSSNPLVMYVNQTGLSWATSPGTAIIRYTSPSGVNFSEWVMYVVPGP